MGTKYAKVTFNELEAIYATVHSAECMIGSGNFDLDQETKKAVRAMEAIFKRNGIELVEVAETEPFSVGNIVDVETGDRPEE
ncbi:hypothetical protein [Neptuniibacter sp. QD37_11]|uniref:hypothetical protein n=1 Tax=Neptuniibacter sp. QD37_11 TaxID=3398209 RepID=UPI0039F56B1F